MGQPMHCLERHDEDDGEWTVEFLDASGCICAAISVSSDGAAVFSIHDRTEMIGHGRLDGPTARK